jgi:hypothetical protein
MSKHNQRKDQPGGAPARFAVGSKVRVKPGIMDPDFEDIPLGGWAGTLTEVDARSSPPTYLVEWDRYTLEHMHPVYRKRCERDDLGVENMWLGEDDLVPDDGSPPVIEQPTAIRTRPLNPKGEDDRVRAVFGLTADDPLPEVDEETLRGYHRHLAKHLSFPFPATYERETGVLHTRSEAVTVVGLVDADEIDETYGILCEARLDRQQVEVPLGEIEAKKGNPNRRLVEDYCYWFWNWR